MTTKTIIPRRYLAKDFDAYRAEMFQHARTFLGDQIKDLSESGLGGLVIDMCALVGDSLSFYLDHQFNELDVNTAVEIKNIQKLARAAGLKLSGAAPAYVEKQRFFIKVPAVKVNNNWVPDETLLPIIKAGSIVSDGSVEFILLNDINFADKDINNILKATVKILDRTSDGLPKSFSVSAIGDCTSGKDIEETFSINDKFVPFRKITVSQKDVTQILSVVDSNGNTYYEVEALTHDTVYTGVSNITKNSDNVDFVITPIPAPYRFTTDYNPQTRQTTLIFGAGDGLALEDDAVPDPSTFAIPFRGKQFFDKVSITPQKLLKTKTLGVADTNVTLTITYRFGGGLTHNTIQEKINSIKTIKMEFPLSTSAALISAVKSTVATINDTSAVGGEDPLTIDEMRSIIPTVKSSQNRIVTKEDLIARVYSMTTRYGRIFRANVTTDPINPTSSQLFIISRDADNKLLYSSETLKKNLVSWLNPYRLIADSIDIRDASIINIGVKFEIIVSAGLNKSVVLNRAIDVLTTELSQNKLNIDQKISIDNLKNLLFSVQGVSSIGNLEFVTYSGNVNNKFYPGELFDVESQTRQGFLIPPRGGIFELRYAEQDIIAKAV